MSQIFDVGNQQTKKLFNLGTAKVKKNCSRSRRLDHSTKARREQKIVPSWSGREIVEMVIRCISWEGKDFKTEALSKPSIFDNYNRCPSQTDSDG